MWLGIAAGLSLLIWSLARPIHARNVSVNDQQLVYEGLGWQVGAGPQACGNISQTVHTTSTMGDFVTFNFTGNALSVRGPLTTLSIPVAVILDGDVMPVAPQVVGPDGCGILYTQSDIGNDSQEHTVTMVFAADSGSVHFSISGITVDIPEAAPTTAIMSTQFIGMPHSSTLLSGVPSSSSTITTNTTAAPSNMTSSVVMNSGAASGAIPSTMSPTASAVSRSPFVTTPGMTIIIFGAIIGAIVAMLTLLAIFILLRRRITRNSARKLDQETSFGGAGRDSEEGKGKIQEEAGLTPLWSTKKEDLRPHVSKSGPQEAQILNLSAPDAYLAGSIPAPASDTSPHQPAAAPYSSRMQSTNLYPIPLGAAHHGRSPGSDIRNDELAPLPRPVAQSSLRQPPPPIRIPHNLPVPPNIMYPVSHSHPYPGLPTATTLNPMSAYSAAATVGGISAREGPQLRVINRSGSLPGSTIDPPPGFV